MEDFSPRESVETVKNCTQLARGFADSIAHSVALKLLEKQTYVNCCSSLSDQSTSSFEIPLTSSKTPSTSEVGSLHVREDSKTKTTNSPGCGSEAEAHVDGSTGEDSSHLWNVGGETRRRKTRLVVMMNAQLNQWKELEQEE